MIDLSKHKVGDIVKDSLGRLVYILEIPKIVKGLVVSDNKVIEVNDSQLFERESK